MHIPINGFVIRVTRERVEDIEVQGTLLKRTVGAYECYINSFPHPANPDVSGTTVEPGGLDDRSASCGQVMGRIKSGTYRLSTRVRPARSTNVYRGGAKMPVLIAHGTGDPRDVFIQPCEGFRGPAGSIVLTGPLRGPCDEINCADSSNRLARLIKHIEITLDMRVPSRGTHLIEGAWLVIEGDPD